MMQTTKTLDTLIKATKQRSVQRNLVKQVNEIRSRKTEVRKLQKITEDAVHEPPMEIEDSLNLENYHVAGLKHELQSYSLKYSEEDTPRRDFPMPEPNEQPNTRIQKFRDDIIEKKREQKITSIIKSHYKVGNSEYLEVEKREPILVHQEFSQENPKDRSKVTYLNEQNLNIDVNYPFRKETTALAKFCETQTSANNPKSFTIKPSNEGIGKHKSVSQLRTTKTIDLVKPKLQSNTPSDISNATQHKSSKSFSRLRQPTPTHSGSRKSLDCIKTNLMSSHYKTMKSGGKPKISRNGLKENISMGTGRSANASVPSTVKTPIAAKTKAGVSSKVFVQQRFRF